MYRHHSVRLAQFLHSKYTVLTVYCNIDLFVAQTVNKIYTSKYNKVVRSLDSNSELRKSSEKTFSFIVKIEVIQKKSHHFNIMYTYMNEHCKKKIKNWILKCNECIMTPKTNDL